MREFINYKIEIFGLKNGTHDFEFSFDQALFEAFEHSLLRKGKGTCKVEMNKTDSMITLHFEVQGTLELECDRSLELFDHPIQTTKELIYKYGDEEQELSEDVYVITKGTQELNIASFLFEIIHLEIPMKKVHPKYQDSDESDEMIFSSEKEEQKEDRVDPRWEALKKLK